jgi:hypothetical protein
MSWKYGRIHAQMPVMSLPFMDPGSAAQATPQKKISRTTATIVLTKDVFYFGDLEAFTEKFSDVRNKFFVPHIDGRPEVATLLDTMSRWMKARSGANKPVRTDVVILLPSAEIPLPIVIQVLHWIKKSQLYEQAILASEIQ